MFDSRKNAKHNTSQRNHKSHLNTTIQRTSAGLFGFAIAAALLVVPLFQGCASRARELEIVHVAKIAEAKTYIEAKALELKHSPNLRPMDLNQGRELYEKARSSYQCYLSTLETRVRRGDRLDSQELTRLANAAGQNADVFTGFAQSKSALSARTPVVLIAIVLVESGIKIWEAYLEQSRKEREAEAKLLHDRLTWRTWDQISE